MVISEEELRILLQHAFDEGWVGYQESRDSVVETLIFGYLEMKKAQVKRDFEREKKKVEAREKAEEKRNKLRFSYSYSYDPYYY